MIQDAWVQVIQGILIPFGGTALGAAFVFVMRREAKDLTQRALTGFASGIMVAASFFSLLLPAIEESAGMGRMGFVPASVGFLVGVGFLLVLDMVIPHMHLGKSKSEEGPRSGLPRTTKLVLAVTLHNLPEGMAVGVVFAGWLWGNEQISYMSALVLALGIAIQNVPEGAIVSMPLRAEGMAKWKTFCLGALSGAVEPLGALATIFAAGVLLPVMPYLLGFAAGAMMYVVVEELIPEMAEGKHSNAGTVCFAAGFVLMMALDTALG